jgi:tripartite ATP-independent transporter DctP family solute receptor
MIMKTRRVYVAALTVLAMCFIVSSVSWAEDKIRLSSSFHQTQPSTVSMQIFKTELAKLTNNQLVADLFPANQLGGAKEGVDGVRAGTIFGTWVSTSFLTRIAPEVESLSVPFLFSGRESAFRLIDGPSGKAIEQKLRDRGLVLLGWMELGERHLTNNKRPVKTAADMKGLKIRLQPNETHLASFRALGANPITMDVSELYSALQQGVVDGQENPYTVIASNRYQEVQKYLSTTGHFFEFIAIVVNRSQFEGMKPEYQAAIRKAMAMAVQDQRANAAAGAEAAFKELKAKGMQITVVTPEAIAEMKKLTAPVVQDVKKRVGAQFMDDVLAQAAKK